MEPNQGNVRQWLDNLFIKFSPMEQARWNQSNIDTLFYAGAQDFINRHFNFSPTHNYKNFYFNLIQQPVNMVTGYQRQHRKAINYVPSEGADPHTTDQYTRLITHVCNSSGIYEKESQACELSAISGMVLLQPYLDYMGDDPAQGNLKVKLWEYSSFMVDPYFREPDMSDAQFVWCQEYISKREAEARFKEKMNTIGPMTNSPQRYGNFYFLPENYNMARNDLMVLSYVWYKWKRTKKRLYSSSRNQFFDYNEDNPNLDMVLYHIPDLEVIEVEVPTWKVAVVLNDQLLFNGFNPSKTDDCPFVCKFWNYEPHINQMDLRVRSLVRCMRDINWLFNRRIILNHDISESSINSGWKRKVGAVANQENLKRSGQGWDLLINEGFEMTDVEKIIPNSVPASDMQLADQLLALSRTVSGIDLENWSGQQDKQISTLTMLIKQAANLMVFQKYFDQWDYSFKLLGDRMLKLVLNNWNEAKVSLLIGEEPSPHFFSSIFAKYNVTVEEGLLTPTQQNLAAQQKMDMNQSFGREVFPPSMIVKDMNIQDKANIMKYFEEQEQKQSAIEDHATNIQHVFQEAQLKELYSRAAANIATARERHGRAESNIGLFEERLSEISENHSISVKNKVEALAKLLETLSLYGGTNTQNAEGALEQIEGQTENDTDRDKVEAKQTAMANNFFSDIMKPSNNVPSMQGQQQQQPAQQAMGE